MKMKEMKNLQRDSVDFAKAKVGPLFRSIFFPTLLSMVFTSLLTVADGIFVGQGIGSDALAAINIVAPLFLVTTGVALMFGAGVSVVASIHLSQGNARAADINVTQSLSVAPLLMALIAALLYVARVPFLRLLGCSDALLPLALDYLVPLLPGTVFMLLQNIGAFVIRLDGSPNFASAVGVIPGVVNVLLDWLLVFPLQMGIAGSSVATTISCAIGAVMVIAYMWRGSRTVHLYRLKLSRTSLWLTVRNVGYMVRSGFPSMLGELALSVMMITGNCVFIRALGDDGVAAFSVACYLYPIVYMVNNAVAQSAQPIISFNHGAGKTDRVREAFRLSVRTGVCCGLLAVALLVLGAHPLVGLFLREGSAPYAIATSGLPLFATAAVFFALNIVFIGYCQATEKNLQATLFMLLRGMVLLVPAFLLVPLAVGIPGLWLAVPVVELLTMVVFFGTTLQQYRTGNREK